jgi:F-type H+-transporting ATPase subunit gamma
MAKTRFIRKRIISVRNIYKITRTMERVAQSKVMKLTGRFAHARSFRRDAGRLLSVAFGVTPGSVFAAQELAREPLTAARPPGKVLLVLVTSSRGLCGGYNSRVIHAARARMRELSAEGREPLLAVLGKKGLAYFRFYGQPVLIPVTDADEAVPFRRIDEVVSDITARFLRREFDAAEVISTRFKTKVLQEVRRTPLLPFAPWAPTTGIPTGPALPEAPAPEALDGVRPVYFVEPAPPEVRAKLLPLALKVDFFCTVLEAFLSEHAQRAVAMRSASDNAQSMMKRLTLQYNRARQAQITNEMIEIVSGSEGSRA